MAALEQSFAEGLEGLIQRELPLSMQIMLREKSNVNAMLRGVWRAVDNELFPLNIFFLFIYPMNSHPLIMAPAVSSGNM